MGPCPCLKSEVTVLMRPCLSNFSGVQIAMQHVKFRPSHTERPGMHYRIGVYAEDGQQLDPHKLHGTAKVCLQCRDAPLKP